MNITETEIQMLEQCKSEQEWGNACDSIKKVRGGSYPSDWWPKVMLSGLANRVLNSFGSTSEIKISVLTHSS